MKQSEQLHCMIVLATNRHQGQKDKGGMPYILHPLKVMHYLNTEDTELMAIAVGHDLLEDTFRSIEEGVLVLQDMGFSERVILGILCCSKVPGETFEQYEQRVMSNKDSIKVKMCDLRHNTDIRRLKGLTEADFLRTAKYHKFYKKLEARDLELKYAQANI
jgi:(p)ppGpp synthase/HD superfamily hydrolase